MQAKLKLSCEKKETKMVGIVSEARNNLCYRDEMGNFYNRNRSCVREEKLCKKVVHVYIDHVMLKLLFRININIYLLNSVLPSTYG